MGFAPGLWDGDEEPRNHGFTAGTPAYGEKVFNDRKVTMTLSRTPGPIGSQPEGQPIDPGTLARWSSPVPGPIGLQIHLPILMAPKAIAPPQLGITVHQASQISAPDWVKKINDSSDVPDYIKEQIKAKGSVIYVTSPRKFKIPNDVIPRDWISDWLSVFIANEWEMTTGCLDFSVKKGDAAGPFITVVHNPDLSSGESVEGFTQYTMTVKGRSTGSIAVERGNTLPTVVTLKSGKKVIAIANRIALSLDGKVIGQCMKRHRHHEFIRFLNVIDARVANKKTVHVIVDNYAAHKHLQGAAMAGAHPRWTFHFTPTSASWLNPVEGFFAKLNKQHLKRGVFHSAVRSKPP